MEKMPLPLEHVSFFYVLLFVPFPWKACVGLVFLSICKPIFLKTRCPEEMPTSLDAIKRPRTDWLAGVGCSRGWGREMLRGNPILN